MVTVRPMQFEDVDEVFAIESSTHRIPWGRTTLQDCVLVGYDCRVLEQLQDSKSKIVGYIISRNQLDAYHILNICIEGSYQNQGLGKIILTTVLDSLVNTSIREVLLEVRPSNYPALRLYQGFGFQQIEIKKGYYKDSIGEEDALVLKKQL